MKVKRFLRWLFRRRTHVFRSPTHISQDFVDDETRRARGRRDWYKKPPDQTTRR